MIIVLQVAGAVAVLIGLVAIGAGIPVKEFSFGNTMILAGTVGLCTGMILLGLSVVAREFRMLARRLTVSARSAQEQRARPALPPFPSAQAAGDTGSIPSRDQAPPSAPPEPPPVAPFWQEDTAQRARPDAPPELGASQAPPVPSSAKQRRNLLFTSTMRRDREDAPPRLGDVPASDVRPPLTSPAAEPSEAPPASFEDAWPKPDRARSAEKPPRRPGRLTMPAPDDPPVATGAPAERTTPPPSSPTRSEEQPDVTVLKSGVVDGMAYSLYSDGSIEAQMPEGMMRFASIEELRAHLDQRS